MDSKKRDEFAHAQAGMQSPTPEFARFYERAVKEGWDASTAEAEKALEEAQRESTSRLLHWNDTKAERDAALAEVKKLRDALEKVRDLLEEGGAYLVEDGFEEPEQCRQLSVIIEALAADIGKGKDET